MPQPYLTLFNPIDNSLRDAVERIEPLLATSDLTFDGTVRRFERGPDGTLYYQLDTLSAKSVTEGIGKALLAAWPGVALECRRQGYDTTVGVFNDAAGTTLVLDEDSVLFYERERDKARYEEWLALLVQLAEALNFSISIFRKGGLKQAVSAAEVLADIRTGRMATERDPILAIIRADLLPFSVARALNLEGVNITASTLGYIVISSLHRE